LVVVCIVAVGLCTYAVDFINHKRQSRAGLPSVFPAVKNVLLATVLAGALTAVATSVEGDAPLHTEDAHIAQLARQAVVDRLPRQPAPLGG
jgi:hypothetical protein